MAEFWENAFQSNKKMWGERPADNTFTALELFNKREVKNLLVPGFGYGRNAKVFYDHGIRVSGIEISKTAIDRAHKYFGNETIIHHGSVEEMPFNEKSYDAIYCYSLIHLLDKKARIQLLKDCYRQLENEGIMVFIALSVNDKRFGVGKEATKNTFKSPHGLSLYFYNEAAIKKEFENYNIIKMKEIQEPIENPKEIFWMVVCEKLA